MVRIIKENFSDDPKRSIVDIVNMCISDLENYGEVIRDNIDGFEYWDDRGTVIVSDEHDQSYGTFELSELDTMNADEIASSILYQMSFTAQEDEEDEDFYESHRSSRKTVIREADETTKVTKQDAKKAWDEGKQVFAIPNRLKPNNQYGIGAWYDKESSGNLTFEKFFTQFCYFCCNDKLGKEPLFFIQNTGE